MSDGQTNRQTHRHSRGLTAAKKTGKPNLAYHRHISWVSALKYVFSALKLLSVTRAVSKQSTGIQS